MDTPMRVYSMYATPFTPRWCDGDVHIFEEHTMGTVPWCHCGYVRNPAYFQKYKWHWRILSILHRTYKRGLFRRTRPPT